MRKLIESTLVSLDGVIGSPDEWSRFDEESRRLAEEELENYDALVLGRVTYEFFRATWFPHRRPLHRPDQRDPQIRRPLGRSARAEPSRRAGAEALSDHAKTQPDRPYVRGGKLADALLTIVDVEEPPFRFIAGADAIEQAEAKLAERRQQIDAHRELSLSLALDEVAAATAREPMTLRRPARLSR